MPPLTLSNVDLTGRQFKIRVVERMSALAKSTAETTGVEAARHMSTSTTEGEALLGMDDDALLNASDEDLNTMSMQAAEQLVHALTRMADANEDDLLRQELWMLDDNGFSFLHYICMYGYTSLIPVVLECISRGNSGVDALSSAVNKRTQNGLYPLHLAVSGVGGGSVEMVRDLMRAGAVSTQEDINGNQPAVYTTNVEILKILNYGSGNNGEGRKGGDSGDGSGYGGYGGGGGGGGGGIDDDVTMGTQSNAHSNSEMGTSASSFPSPSPSLSCNVFGASLDTNRKHQGIEGNSGDKSSSDGSDGSGKERGNFGSPDQGRHTHGSSSSSSSSSRSDWGGTYGTAHAAHAAHAAQENGKNGTLLFTRSSSSSPTNSPTSSFGRGGHPTATASNSLNTPSSPNSPNNTKININNINTDATQLLLGAFKTLSIHDRVALSIGLNNKSSGSTSSPSLLSSMSSNDPQRQQHSQSPVLSSLNYSGGGGEHDREANDRGFGGGGYSGSSDRYSDSGSDFGELFSDSASMISESDVVEVLLAHTVDSKSIAAAMNPSEQDTLREQVSLIQSNVKAWLVRRNFKNMCNATHLLQRSLRGKLARRDLQRLKTATKTIENRRLAALTRRRFVSMGKAVTALQAAHRGIAERSQFKEIRTQLSAALIMNFNWIAPKSPPQLMKVKEEEEEEEEEEDEDL